MVVFCRGWVIIRMWEGENHPIPPNHFTIFPLLNNMSTLHHEDLLLSIFDEVQEAFPYLDEDKQIEIANNRFEDLCQ